MINILLLTLFTMCAGIFSPDEIGIIEHFQEPVEDEQRTVNLTAWKWPQGIVPYVIDESYSERDVRAIRSAMDEIEDETCIRWVNKNDSDIAYVSIQNRNSCWLKTVRPGGKQIMYLESPHCMTRGHILHVLLTTLGLLPEHRRPDRDQYVIINWDNVADTRSFEKFPPGIADTFGLAYDFRSVMHYPAYAHAKNKRVPTIKSNDSCIPDEDLGLGLLRGYLTLTDVEKIKISYRCMRETE